MTLLHPRRPVGADLERVLDEIRDSCLDKGSNTRDVERLADRIYKKHFEGKRTLDDFLVFIGWMLYKASANLKRLDTVPQEPRKVQ